MTETKTYLAKCISAKFDEQSDALILFCNVDNIGQKTLSFARKDFFFKKQGVEVPINEMHRTADLFLGKVIRISLEVNEDVNSKIAAESPVDLMTRCIGE